MPVSLTTGVQMHRTGWQRHRQLVAGGVDGRLRRLHRALDDLGNRHRSLSEFQLVAADAGHIKQIVDQPDHMRQLPVHLLLRAIADGWILRLPHHLEAVANRRQRVSEFVGQQCDELVFLSIRFRQRQLRLLAIGHVAGRARDRFDLAIRADHRHEDVVIDAATIGARERHLAANRLLRGADLIDLPVVHLGVPRLVADFQERLSKGALAASAPHSDQRLVGVEPTENSTGYGDFS